RQHHGAEPGVRPGRGPGPLLLRDRDAVLSAGDAATSSERVLRFEVPDREALERLATGPLPAGLSGDETRVDFFREIYFDTPSRDLEERGVTVRLRVRRDGSRLLTLDVRERATAEAQVLRTHAVAPVPDEEIQRSEE